MREASCMLLLSFSVGMAVHFAIAEPPDDSGRVAVGSISSPFTVGNVATYLSDKWRLGWHEALLVSHSMLNVASKYDLDPLLLMAVAATESSFQHSVGNPGGGNDPLRPYGIMQVAGRWHPDKFEGGIVRRTTVHQNVELGAQVLVEYLEREQGDLRRALLRYNGSLNTGNQRYADKVERYRKEFRDELVRL